MTRRIWYGDRLLHLPRVASVQTLEPGRDGSVTMRLAVCVDRPLKRWLLGFGSGARVLSPSSRAAELFSEFDAARARYEYRTDFPMLKMSAREPFQIRRSAAG